MHATGLYVGETMRCNAMASTVVCMTVKAHDSHKVWQNMCVFRTGYLKAEQHLRKSLLVIL